MRGVPIGERTRAGALAGAEPPETYRRPLSDPEGRVATCPACLRGIQLDAAGRMVRHGWRETGRQVGQIGLGRQSGACAGVGLSPLEVTDADARRFLCFAERYRDEQLSLAAEHRERPHGVYPYSRTFDHLHADEATFAVAQAAAAKAGAELRRVGARSVMLMASIHRPAERTFAGYFAGLRLELPSWEEARAAEESTATERARAKERYREQLARAIDDHTETPRIPEKAAKRSAGPAVHYERVVVWPAAARPSATEAQRTRRLIACGNRSFRAQRTEDKDLVTCSRCLKQLETH